jgi:hypothetical protein
MELNMINEFTMATVSKSIVKDWDDGETIFLDYEKLTDEEINNLSLGRFDVINIPKKSFDNTIPNYYCSFFYSLKSQTGYGAIFVNKDRETYHNLKHITRKDF